MDRFTWIPIQTQAEGLHRIVARITRASDRSSSLLLFCQRAEVDGWLTTRETHVAELSDRTPTWTIVGMSCGMAMLVSVAALFVFDKAQKNAADKI